ncbi:CPA1 family monovalent cation:H+ antiporter [Catenuloplanes nepalensis]|uniref:CPA1 family monovalent cation:H+ antiporter n=1 Tax=Catenuloplanes nepalensis TaxID=587533 RepID=A0ABT9MVR0_9ACTN|nr:Na+/H+ antiporter [Catenuloplanes nepalensis]MDP9795465.1 CPA1 family monovalent cation:H+ antiporter [Catenuloplanes nepalensis]
MALVLGGLVVVMVANAVAHRSGLPASVLLVCAGIGYGYLPGPNLELHPDVVLYLVIPPLLYAAALESSLTAIKRNMRTVLGLSVGLVLATALLVGLGLDLFVTGVTLAAGLAVGAAVAPPDPVAALSIGRKAGLPPRLITLVEGEGLLNDATALTILKVAVLATVSGHLSVGHAVGEFALMAAGGLAIGLASAWLLGQVRRRITDPLIDTAMSLGTPFAVFLVAEEIHVSGVLAVVVCGLWLGHRAPSMTTSRSRLQSRPVWHFVEYLLEGYVFVLIGQQLPSVLRALGDYSWTTIASAAAITLAVVLLLRPIWLYVMAHLPGRMHARLGGDPNRNNPPLSMRELTALTWAGTRGVITLAAVFTLPAATPNRPLLLFCAYIVVLVTLIGQGLTFAPLLRALRIPGTDVSRARTRNEARAAAMEAAVARLDELEESDDPAIHASLPGARRLAEARLQRYRDRLAMLNATEDEALPVNEEYRAAQRARREMITAQREELLAWRDSGMLADADLRILERELDHEESILPAPGKH